MIRMMLLCLLTFSQLIFTMDGNAMDSHTATRAAIDFGSGALKIQVAIVDTANNRIVGEPLLAKYVPLNLTEDVATHHGSISEEMIQKSLAILKSFQDEANAVTNKQGVPTPLFSGVATAVFRKAHNGSEVLSIFHRELGLSFKILSQDSEGVLGYTTAKALFPKVAEDSLLAWDSGNGSFQMTAKVNPHNSQDPYNSGDSPYAIYLGPLGHGTVRVLLSKDIRQGTVLKPHEFGNPITADEAALLSQKIKELLPHTPTWLQDKISQKDVHIATFGDGESIFFLVTQALGLSQGLSLPVNKSTITIEDAKQVRDRFIGISDDVFLSLGLHRKTCTSAILLHTIMEHFGIKTIHYSRSMGNTPGMLITPDLW